MSDFTSDGSSEREFPDSNQANSQWLAPRWTFPHLHLMWSSEQLWQVGLDNLHLTTEKLAQEVK